MDKAIGFTLMELIIVIAIIAIIGSIAYPSYLSYTLKMRRGEAKMQLIKAQLKQSSIHILSPNYSSDEAELGLTNSDYYTFSVISADMRSYLMQAVAKGQQVNDTGCMTLTINQDNHYTPLNCW